MEIRKLRSTSMGIEGTMYNANHHAQLLIPLIEELISKAPLWGFAEWAQGNNVHLFTTHDGRKFLLRPISLRDRETLKSRYVGIQLLTRVSRSTETPLLTIFYDNRNGVTPLQFGAFMAALSEPQCKYRDPKDAI